MPAQGTEFERIPFRVAHHAANVSHCDAGNATLSLRRIMVSTTIKLVKWLAVVIAVALASVLGVRAWDSQRGPPLELWHTYVPHEMTARGKSALPIGQATSPPNSACSTRCERR